MRDHVKREDTQRRREVHSYQPAPRPRFGSEAILNSPVPVTLS